MPKGMCNTRDRRSCFACNESVICPTNRK